MRAVGEAELAQLAEAQRLLARGEAPPRPELAAATRTAVRVLAQRHPGRIIELRVPPFAAAQLGDGTPARHTRGTPPHVVETDPETLLALAAGTVGWGDAVASGRVRASGTRSDLSGFFPL